MIERKGYAIFFPDGEIHLPSIRPTQSWAIDSYTSGFAWERYVSNGFTVRHVTISETEPDHGLTTQTADSMEAFCMTSKNTGQMTMTA